MIRIPFPHPLELVLTFDLLCLFHSNVSKGRARFFCILFTAMSSVSRIAPSPEKMHNRCLLNNIPLLAYPHPAPSSRFQPFWLHLCPATSLLCTTADSINMWGVSQARPALTTRLWSLGRALYRLKSKFLSLTLHLSSRGLSLATMSTPPHPTPVDCSLQTPASPLDPLLFALGIRLAWRLHLVIYYSLSKHYFLANLLLGHEWLTGALDTRVSQRA